MNSIDMQIVKANIVRQKEVHFRGGRTCELYRIRWMNIPSALRIHFLEQCCYFLDKQKAPHLCGAFCFCGEAAIA